MERLTTNSLPSGLRMTTISRRPLLRTSVGLAAAGAIARPYIARAQSAPTTTVMNDPWRRAPRTVVYYNAENPVYTPTPTDPLPSLTAIGGLPYTDVIIGFLIPGPGNTYLVGDNSNIWGNNNDINSPQLQTLKSYITQLRYGTNQNGMNPKNVLLSVGGAINYGWTSALYQQWYERGVGALAQEIAAWVNNLGASGVDIDFEDDQALESNGTYNGVDFLTTLTRSLFPLLNTGPMGGNIITHAPPSPFWDTNPTPVGSYNGAYRQVNSNGES